MADAIVRVNIDEKFLARQFIPGGSANRYLDRRVKNAVRFARALAPKRTGNLSKSVHKTGTLNRGILSAVSAMYNDAPYARAVSKGTLGLRMGPHGKDPMPIPKAGVRLPYRVTGVAGMYFPVGPGHRKKTVGGQAPNHYMVRAMRMGFRNTID